jgi:hypothetical protein
MFTQKVPYNKEEFANNITNHSVTHTTKQLRKYRTKKKKKKKKEGRPSLQIAYKPIGLAKGCFS